MTLVEVLEIINTGKSLVSTHATREFLKTSLHTRGVLPIFKTSDGGYANSNQDYIKDYQRIFDEHLLSRHPREDKATRNWRLSQYKPFTRSPFTQLTEVLRGSIFQDGQYFVELPNKKDNDYIFSKNFGNDDLFSYFSVNILPRILDDPNGYIVRIPTKPSYDIIGEIGVKVEYVCTKEIIVANNEDFVYYSENRKYVYWITKKAIIRFVKNKEGKWVVENESGYYAHLLDRLPIDVLGGIKENGYFSSYFSGVIPIADEFVSNYSAKQLIDKEASHPYIQQMAIECIECSGNGSVQVGCEIDDLHPNGFKLDKCPKCFGKKYLSINPADRFEVDKKDMDTPAIRLISPDINLNEYHKKNSKDLYNEILEGLNLTTVSEAQSGVAKAIDQEKLHQFISTISNHLFGKLIFNTIKDVISYRNIKSVNGTDRPADYEFVFVKPQQFSIKTANDLMKEVADSQIGVPSYIRRQIINEFVDKRFANDELMKKKSLYLLTYDYLACYDVKELQGMELNPFDKLFNAKAPILFDRLLKAKGQNYILTQELDSIHEEIIKLLENGKTKATN